MTSPAAPRKPEPCAVLYRVSTNKQIEDNQVEDVTAHSASHNYVIYRDPVDGLAEFRLHDVSATGEQAAVLAKILRQVAAGKYKVLVIANSARIDRRDPMVAMHWLTSLGVIGGRVEAAREPEFNLDNLAGWVHTVFAQHQNAEFIKTLKANVDAGMAKVRENEALDGMAPWAYAIEGE